MYPESGAMYPRGLRGSSVPRGPGYTGPGYSTPEREEVHPFGRWVGDLERRRSVLFWVVCVKGSTIYRIFGCYPHLARVQGASIRRNWSEPTSKNVEIVQKLVKKQEFMLFSRGGHYDRLHVFLAKMWLQGLQPSSGGAWDMLGTLW